MICRHGPGDPGCSKNGGGHVAYYAAETQRAYEKRLKELEDQSPDAANYTIERVERVDRHLVLMVRYPNCAKCAYEGNKVMVFLNVSEADALRWRRIDPHFRDPKLADKAGQAPTPAARFPASEEGWADALTYAHTKPSKPLTSDEAQGMYNGGVARAVAQMQNQSRHGGR